MNPVAGMKPEYPFKMSHNVQLGHRFKLFKKQLNKGLNLKKKYFFSQRTVDTWNDLPDRVVNVKTTKQFNNRIDDYRANHEYGTL